LLAISDNPEHIAIELSEMSDLLRKTVNLVRQVLLTIVLLDILHIDPEIAHKLGHQLLIAVLLRII